MANTTYQTGRTGSPDLTGIADDARNIASNVVDDAAGIAARAQDQAAALGRKAVDQFHAATEYVRGHDAQEMVSDLKSWVKAHPTQALVAAVAIGFVAAAFMRRR